MKRRRIKGKKLISKKNASVIEFNIPTNINMGGVSNLNAVEEDEDKKEENEDEEEEDDDDDFNDDNQNEINQPEEDTDMPLDYLRYNRKKTNAVKPGESVNASVAQNNNTNVNNSIVNNPPENNNKILQYQIILLHLL